MTGESLAEETGPGGRLGEAGLAGGGAEAGDRGALESWAPVGLCTKRAAGKGSEFRGAWLQAVPKTASDPKAAHTHGNGRRITKAHLSCNICSIARVRPRSRVAAGWLYRNLVLNSRSAQGYSPLEGGIRGLARLERNVINWDSGRSPDVRHRPW